MRMGGVGATLGSTVWPPGRPSRRHTPYAVDVGAQVPHVAMRLYVMGERCYDDATRGDMVEMRRLNRGGARGRRTGVPHVALLRARRQGREPGAGHAKDPRGHGQRSPYSARSSPIAINLLKPTSNLPPTSGLVRNAG